MIENVLILSSSARLAHSIQADLARAQALQQSISWHTPVVCTYTKWLTDLIEEYALTGVIQPQTLLTLFQEQLLWESVIARSLKKKALGTLFDVAGLARAAIEANDYLLAWNLSIPPAQQTEETHHFLHWQHLFQEDCRRLGVLEGVRHMTWQLDCLEKIERELPACISFAGFDQQNPQEQRLRALLSRRGVRVVDYVTTHSAPVLAQHVSLDNQEVELRAAVAWAQKKLAEHPDAKLAMVVPNLKEVRNKLADLLDDVFCPARIRSNGLECARNYDFSLGTPLAQQLMIQAALHAMRLLSMYEVQQTDISRLLCSPFFWVDETDARALLDARMREKLPPQFTLAHFVTFIQQQQTKDLSLPCLLEGLRTSISILAGVPHRKLNPSQWIAVLESLLAALHWQGLHPRTSVEFQMRQAWKKALQQLAAADVFNEKISATEVVRLLEQICSAQVFQTEVLFTPSIQILGIMEALSAPVDALWCMHMNDHIWPPAARPNPLLPASVQRTHNLPNADHRVQMEFARRIHHRLMCSAREIVFSSSKMDGTSLLRISPLMRDVECVTASIPLAVTLAEKLSNQRSLDMVFLEDHVAPIVPEEEHVGGGTGLLKAQAVCPAWAFYQYRLGARALKTPSRGLDDMKRGALVHAVLEHFWEDRHFSDLRSMSEAEMLRVLKQNVEVTIQSFARSHFVVSKTMLELESERLVRLVSGWLQHEKGRGVVFEILACEAKKEVSICGIEVTLKVDRIHQLENGKIEFIDYKTGSGPKRNSWGEARITEPQLPIYAVWWGADLNQVAGVHFAMVKTAEHDFIGISEENFISEAKKKLPAGLQKFEHWLQCLAHWKVSIEAMAQEIKAGESAVRFDDEKLLVYCEVLPLLRLPERKVQFERIRGDVL